MASDTQISGPDLKDHPANPPVKTVLSGSEGARAMELLREACRLLDIVEPMVLDFEGEIASWRARYKQLPGIS